MSSIESRLPHDKDGFLIGELIEGQRDVLAEQQAGAKVWRSIDKNVAAIARAMGLSARQASSRAGRVAPVEPAGRRSTAGAVLNGAARTRTGAPQGRDSVGRFVAAPKPLNRLSRALANEADSKRAAATTLPANRPGEPAGRDARERFAGGPGDAPAGDREDGGLGSRLAARLGGLSEAIKGLGTGAEQIDPAVSAMHEVKTVLEPIGRGAFSMLGRSQQSKKERWYKRLLEAITKGGSASSAKGPTGLPGSGGNGLGGLLGPLLAGILPMLGNVLMRVFLPIAALWGSFELGKWLGGKVYDWLDRSGIATKVFDAFDAIGTWFSDKVKKPIAQAKADFEKGQSDVDRTRITRDQLRRSELTTTFREDGGVVPGSPNTPLAPAKSTVESLGRAKGHAKNFLVENLGFRPLDSINDPTKLPVRGSKSQADKNRAIATGQQYAAGNIGGLSDAQTRALVASTVLTESAGGKTDIVNSAGYMGRYQAGAGWLADAGLIKGGSAAVKTAMKADGFSNEYKWGKSGGMTRFLKNDKNWDKGMSYDQYLGDASAQDSAFKTNSDAAYADLMRKGVINANTPPQEVAGLLKARHLAGMGGAQAVAAGGTGPADANGTTARKYFDDVAKDRGGFQAVFSSRSSTATAGVRPVTPVSVPVSVPAKLPEAPQVSIDLPGKPEKSRPVTAVMREPIGQDVGDRNIAHIVTGGLGGA